jgi:mannitol-1-/sugar-/sorbitol-6-phosphatase
MVTGDFVMQEISCRAILFDLDGVLVDSTVIVARHWRAWAMQHALDGEFVLAYAHGKRTIDTLYTFASSLAIEPEQELALFEKRASEDTEGLISVPGAVELLRKLTSLSHNWAIVTSCSRIIAAKRLHALCLPVPQVFVTAENVCAGKPHPEGYLKAAELLGQKTQDCLVIEDTATGIQAARAAGCLVIGLTTTFPATDLADANFIVPSLASLNLDLSKKGILSFSLASRS